MASVNPPSAAEPGGSCASKDFQIAASAGVRAGWAAGLAQAGVTAP
jgi:hypothetical protein